MGSDMGCKVDAAIERYDLDTADPRYESINTGLLARWTGTEGEPEGYRPLTEWFNKRLLKRVYDEHGRDSIVRLESEYDALTNGDEVVRAEVVADIETDGIDAEQVVSDMVSWGTMRTHLTECLGGEKDAHTAQTNWEYDTIEMAREYAARKVSQAVSSLATKGKLRGHTHSTVDIQVHVRCDSCPTRVPLDVALERGYVCEQHSSL